MPDGEFMAHWTATADRAPEGSGKYLACTWMENRPVIYTIHYRDQPGECRQWRDYMYDWTSLPDYWMPLPELPVPEAEIQGQTQRVVTKHKKTELQARLSAVTSAIESLK